MQAFDWDRDCDQLLRRGGGGGGGAGGGGVASVPGNPFAPERDTERASGLARGAAPAPVRGRLVFVGVAGGLLLAGAGLLAPRVGLPATGAASRGPVIAAALRPGGALPAVDLRVYGPEQVAAFRRGIARFSDADLLTHASGLERDLAAGGSLAPWLADMLALSRHEMARRGLPGTAHPR